MDRETLREITSSAISNVGIDIEEVAIALPDSMSIMDLEKLQMGRRRFRGSMSTTMMKSFVEYVTSINPEAPCFVSTDPMIAKAFFNLGTQAEPGHGDYTAILRMAPTAAYQAMLTFCGNHKTQKQTAEFLEDWSDFILAYNSDGEKIHPSAALAAIRDITIDTARSTNNAESDLRSSRSAMEDIEASSSHQLPHMFEFTCTPYLDLDIRSFVLRLGVITAHDKPHIMFRIERGEAIRDEMAEEFRGVLTDQLARANIFFGSFEP